MGRKVNLVGKQFGQLTVLARGSQDRWKRFKWLCRCACGVEKEIHGRHLVSGKTQTCGCGYGVERPKPALGLTGDKHPKWKGGRYITSQGYVMVYQAPGKYAFEHRLVAKPESDDLVVHHKNHDKQDNRPENLEVMTRQEHAKEHNLGTAVRGRERLLRALEVGQ